MADASINRITQQLEGLTISSSNIQSVGEEIGRGAYGSVHGEVLRVDMRR